MRKRIKPIKLLLRGSSSLGLALVIANIHNTSKQQAARILQTKSILMLLHQKQQQLVHLLRRGVDTLLPLIPLLNLGGNHPGYQYDVLSNQITYFLVLSSAFVFGDQLG